MPDINRNTNNRVSGRRREAQRADYSRGNRNWNTQQYKDSVKTGRTETIALKSSGAPKGRSAPYYYDNTPAALRERRRKSFEKKREMWRESVRKNRRRRIAMRRFLSFIIISATLLAVVTASYKLFFVAKNITVEGSTLYTDDEIIRAAGLDTRKNLFSFSSREASNSIRFYCPRVVNADFDKTIPNNVKIEITEEAPVYCAEIYGDLYAISDSLTVMDKVERAEGLIKLKLQTVSYAVSGSKLILDSERAETFLESIDSLLDSSPLKSKLTQIDLRNDFDIRMVAENKYLMMFGTQDDMEIKLRLADAMLKDEVFDSGSRAIINLEDTTKTSVIIDNQLTFD
ncbi:MAG: FtsQ-type POTRA domain-containing protein [Clostridia bacterium]|nr:FtsQ-type POTRA domain-containing protein [Clostridia bacterium]